MKKYKISNDEFEKVSIARLATNPGARTRYGEGAKTGEELKARMDEPSRLFMAKFNALIDLIHVNAEGDSLLKHLPTGIGDNHTFADLVRDIVSESAEFASYLSVGERTLLEELVNFNNALDEHMREKNPHKITAETVGLDKVDNTSDEEKPLSLAARLAIEALGREISAAEAELIEEIAAALNQAKGYADATKVGKVGDQTISGALSVGGDLLVGGNTYAKQIESLEVGDAVIVANADGVLLSELSGYVIRVNGAEAYAIVYDPADDCVKIGLGTYNSDTKVFTFGADEAQVLATRGEIADGNVPVWDDKKKTFRDSGKKANDFASSESAQFFANALKGSAIGEAVVITDISPVEHDLRFKIKSKNLIPYPFVGDTPSGHYGITWTYNNDGTIGVKGVTTQYVMTHLIGTGGSDNSLSPYLEDGKTYTLSIQKTSGETVIPNAIITYTEKATGTLKYWNAQGANARTHTVDKSKYTYEYIRVFVGGDLAGKEIDCVCAVQLEEGTAATPYTPYIADTEAVKVLVSDGSAEPIAYSQSEAIKSISPTTMLTTDTAGALIEVEYNRDINDAFAKMQQAIVLLGGII